MLQMLRTLQYLSISGLYGGNRVRQAVPPQEESHHHPVLQERSDLADQRPAEAHVQGGQRQAFPAAGVTFQGNHSGQDYYRRRHLDKVSLT